MGPVNEYRVPFPTEGKSQMWILLTRVKAVKDFLPVLGVPDEVGLSEVPLGFAEVAGSDLVSRANL